MFRRSPPAPSVPTILPAQAAPLVASGRALLLDVREPVEWAEARIPGAIHLPLGELPARLDEIARDRKVILQCRSGNRSRAAAEILLAAGFADVANLEGGIVRWAREGHPVEA